MKWNKGIVFSAMFFIAAVGFSIVKLQNVAFIKSQYTSVSIRFKTEGITEDELKTALQNEKDNSVDTIPEVTAWTQLSEEEVDNRNIDRTVTVPLLLVSGDMSLTAPMTLKYGNYVYQEDEKGCVIDSDTAYALYGTENAVDNSLSYQNRDYIVRGVVKTNRPLLIIQGYDSTVKYTNLELIYQNKEQGEVLAGEFLLQNNFPQDNIIIDNYFYANMLHVFYNLPIWVFFLLFNFWIVKALWRKKHELKLNKLIMYMAISILIIIGYGIILYQYTGSPIYISEKLIPTKCSDFGFWSRQYHSIKFQLQQMKYLVPNAKDTFLENEILKAPLTFVVMVILFGDFMVYVRLVMGFDKRGGHE